MDRATAACTSKGRKFFVGAWRFSARPIGTGAFESRTRVTTASWNKKRAFLRGMPAKNMKRPETLGIRRISDRRCASRDF